MSTITLSLQKENLGVSINHGIVARIHGYTAASPENEFPYFKEIIIPATREGGLSVDVDPGRYRVQAILPSGEILQEERQVKEGESVSIVFSAGPSPRHWLSWQNFQGASKAEPSVPEPPAEVKENITPIIMRGLRTILKYMPTIGDLTYRLDNDRGFGGADDEMGPLRDTWRGVPNLASLTLYEQPAGVGPSSWSTAASAAQAADLASLWAPTKKLCAERVQQEGNLALWALDHGGQSRERFWVFSDVADVVEIGSIPLPWSDDQTSSDVEVLVDSSDADLASRTSIVVRDATLGGLLAYLGRGRLANARPLIESLAQDNLIERTIEGKTRNPLAACAAAYVGLSIFETGEPERWDHWLPNIMTRFPWIPDGAIVHARRMLQRPRSTSETDDALAALKEAYRRGIPYFTAGVLSLRDSLLVFRDRDEETKYMLETVSRVATRLDVGQAFTVISFPKV